MPNTALSIPQLGGRFVDDRQRCWGDSYNWDFPRNLDSIVKLAIHHSVTPPAANWQAEVDRIGQEHKANNWVGIGYHFIITSQGVVAYVGDIGLGRANIKFHNEKIIGICLIGDFTKHLPTDIQINSAHDLCDFFINNFPALKNINSWDDIMGHKDAVSLFGNTTATACPGSSWPNDMKERIRNNIVYTPQPLPAPSPSDPPPHSGSGPDPAPTPSEPDPQPKPPADEDLKQEISTLKQQLLEANKRTEGLQQQLNQAAEQVAEMAVITQNQQNEITKLKKDLANQEYKKFASLFGLTLYTKT